MSDICSFAVFHSPLVVFRYPLQFYVVCILSLNSNNGALWSSSQSDIKIVPITGSICCWFYCFCVTYIQQLNVVTPPVMGLHGCFQILIMQYPTYSRGDNSGNSLISSHFMILSLLCSVCINFCVFAFALDTSLLSLCTYMFGLVAQSCSAMCLVLFGQSCSLLL